MRFIVYLLTLFMVGTAVAQNPTILQGNYITNVFGQSNFVLNPNAQTNVANVTVSSATVTRSTTTPLVATTEFNITTSTATGYADWATRTFDQGMKNQNCEARFTYRGFSVGSTTVQIRQGSNTVAQLTLTASTDPRIASINFPCGDLSAATTLRVQQATASLTGTNELSGLYLGLATNQANVAQAELVVRARLTTNQALTNTVSDVIFNTKDLDVYGEFNTSTGVFTAKRAGNYTINTSLQTTFGTWNNGEYFAIEVKKNTNVIASKYDMTEASTGKRGFVSANVSQVSLAVGDTLKVLSAEYASAAYSLDSGVADNYFEIYRFPTSSELVVTPERQNVWGGVTYSRTADAISVGGGAAAPTGYNIYSDSVWNTGKSYYGRCQATDVDANRIGCKIPNMPVGNYKITATGLFYEVTGGAGDVICSQAIYETTTSNVFASTTNKYNNTSGGLIYNGRTLSGIFKNDSVADRNFVLAANKTSDSVSGSTSNCQIFVSNAGGDISNFTIVIEPLDQPSNSALYVQGPVLGAQTGAAIGSGYLGEELSGTNSADFSYVAGTTANVASITLQPGYYLLRGQGKITMNTGSDYGTDALISITSTSAAYDGDHLIRNLMPASGGSNIWMKIDRYVRVTTPTTYYLVMAYFTGGGTLRHINNSNSYLKAIRFN